MNDYITNEEFDLLQKQEKNQNDVLWERNRRCSHKLTLGSASECQIILRLVTRSLPV